MSASGYCLPAEPQVPPSVQRAIAEDYERLTRRGLPDSLEEYLADRYEIDLTTRYGGYKLKNPWGKASGQLSMTAHQVHDDVAAGLGFVVLKTVIAEDAAGARTMQAWAIKEARMVAEPITGSSGETGWTVSWKGRGWWQSFEEYLQLVRDTRRLAKLLGTLVVPSCKYHLPAAGETVWRTEEYEHTTRRLYEAWQESSPKPDAPMPLEKDFSPTLAGSDRSAQQAQILEWLRRVPGLIRDGGGKDAEGRNRVRVGLKLFNALFDDAFQQEMLRICHEPGPQRADFLVYGNRLFDPQREFDDTRGIAYGGPDLSDRNLRVLSAFQDELQQTPDLTPLEWSATGNITTGKMALEYALRGATSFQLHTFFQLPADQYRMQKGSKTEKALFELYFHPKTGFLAWMFHLAEALHLPHAPLRFLDIVGKARQLRA